MASLESFLQRRVVIFKKEAPVHQAARAMCDHKIGCVVVCDEEGSIVGIITDRDLTCTALAEQIDDTTNLTLADVMTMDPVTINESESVEAAIKLMQECGVRRIPVVRESPRNITKHIKRCVGIISLDDLIVAKAVSLETLAAVVGMQMNTKAEAASYALRAARADARSEAHIEQTLNHFHKLIGQRIHFEQDIVLRLTKFILESVVGRIHYKGAAHFIAQLPKGLQEDLLDIPAGPNREITAQTLLLGVMSRTSCSEPQARWILCQFLDVLGQLMDKRTIEYVWVQLPYDMRLVFAESAIIKDFKRRPAVA